jgi:malate permease and related proteins
MDFRQATGNSSNICINLDQNNHMILVFDILTLVLPVFLVIGTGSALKMTRLVDGTFLLQLNRMVYYLALPSLLFYKIASADFSTSFNGVLLVGLLVSIIAGFIFAYGYGAVRGYPPSVHGAFAQGAFRGNLAYIGLPIVFNAYGEKGLAVAGILLGFVIPTLNFLAILALLLPHRDNTRKKGLIFWVRQICGNPLIVASFIGILWSFFRLPMPKIIDSALRIVTGMALPLALISIGASFSWQKMRGDLKKTFLATSIKLVWLPLIAALVLIVLGVRGQDLGIGVLLAGTPTATVAYIMAQQMQGDAELSGSIIMTSTLLSVVTYTIGLYFLKVMGL